MVDSEVMLGTLKQKGYIIKEGVSDCDIAIINTCAFVEDAKQEAIGIILQAAELKNQGHIKKIIVTGCLSQRHREILKKRIHEIDSLLGTSDFDKIINAVRAVEKGKSFFSVSAPDNIYSHNSQRYLLTPQFYTYVKIAEGCNNKRYYCAIYKIRGKHRSRPHVSILKEVNNLTKGNKVSELNIIAQDTTSYGKDIRGEYSLARLLKEIAESAQAHWIRLLYTHPRHFTDELISVINDEGRVCKYIDLPIQHASDRMLKSMNRRVTKSQMQLLIDKIRKGIPAVALRTSVIVGFPGERDEDFKELLEFIRQTKFERLGAFVYSREEDTPAYKFKKQVPDDIKRQRLDEVMKLQQEISTQVNKKWLNRQLEVLIEEKTDKNSYTGRTQYDAPEVDGVVYVHSDKELQPGDFAMVDITDTLEYDLTGEAK